MADAATIARLRLNLGDPSLFDDDALEGYLDAYGGSEPRARLAALPALVAQYREAADFTDGEYAEKSSQLLDNALKLLALAREDVAALDEQEAALTRGKARTPTRVPVQWWFG